MHHDGEALGMSLGLSVDHAVYITWKVMDGRTSARNESSVHYPSDTQPERERISGTSLQKERRAI